MDVTPELSGRVDRMGRDPLPPSWRQDPALAAVESFGELISRVRRLDRGSDDALRALARLAAVGEPEACLVATAALLPLLIARCDRRPDLITEAIPELASRIAEPASEQSAGGVANRLLRRVVWRVRHDYGHRRWQVPMSDPESAGKATADNRFEDPAVDRVALGEFRRRLARRPHGDRRLAADGPSGVADGRVDICGTDSAGQAPPGRARSGRVVAGRLNTGGRCRGGDRPTHRVRGGLAESDVPASRPVGGPQPAHPRGVGVDGGALRPVGRLLATQPGPARLLRGRRTGRRHRHVEPRPIHRRGPAVRAAHRGARSPGQGAGHRRRHHPQPAHPAPRPLGNPRRGAPLGPRLRLRAARPTPRPRRPATGRRAGDASRPTGTRSSERPPAACSGAPLAPSTTPTGT